MNLHTSWKAYFLSITAVNKSCDQNIPGFTDAMNFESSANIKMMALN